MMQTHLPKLELPTMLYISEDKTKFIASDYDGTPCFLREEHLELAKAQGLDLTKMVNLRFAYFKNGKGYSFEEFLNK